MTPMISRRQFAAGATALFGAFVAPPVWAIAGDEDVRLDAFFERIWQRGIDRNPVRQSQLGIKRDQDKWTDISEARAIENIDLLKQDLATLRTFDRARLSPQAQISVRIFAENAEEAIAGFALRRDDYIMTQMGGLHTRIPITLLNAHPIDDLVDARAYCARIEGVGPLLGQVVIELGRQEKAGVRPPRFVYALLIEPSENMLKGKPFDAGPAECPILADFRTKIAKAKLPDTEQVALLARAEAGLKGPFGTGYRTLITHLTTAQAAADDRDGVWKLPRGALFYRQQLKGYTTLPVTPPELHTLGLDQVARIHGEMARIQAKVGFAGTLQDFFTHVRTDPKFFYPATDAGKTAYIADAERLLAEVHARQGELFTRIPKQAVVVRPVEAWREKSAAKAFYQNPPQGGAQPGVFFINLYDLKAQPKWQLAATLYHEAIPGHHFETCIAHDLEDLPRFRRFASNAAFSEGWGLYSECLAKEIGLYPDPYDDFGRLSLELMRACRLVVDTGIHAMKWTRKQAVDYMDAKMPSSHYDNQREVDRYIVLPGQACSYYVGMRKIVELRERAKARLGARFDIRAFHDTVLGNGPLPLPILEQTIDAWVAGGGKAVSA
jgi:uncharacterized protein (DUF885 family)